MKKLLAILLIAGSAVTSFAGPSVLSIKESIEDDAIVYPESFETNTTELMKNWYLQNYIVLDKDAEMKNDVPTSKEDYIERLQALPTVIEMPYNSVVRSYIDMYTQKRRSLVEEMLGLSIYYNPIFEQALEKEGLPLELKYLPVIESALNPDAISRVGATGLWQFMLGTGKQIGLTVNSLVDERRDPIRSSEAAAKYLKQLYNIYGDWSLAIASYNCGPGNVNKALRRAGGGKRDFWEIYFYLPRETRGYVPAFIAANYVMNYYEDHNIGKALAKRPVMTDTVMVNKYVHFNQISEVLNIPVSELRILNPQYRKDIIPGNIRPYSLTLPSKQVYSYVVSEDSIIKHKAELYAHRAEVEITDGAAGTELTKVAKYHKVRRGETLGSIARKYGVSVSSLKKWNGLRKNSIKRGKLLKVYVTRRVPKKEEKKDEVTKETVEKTSMQNADDSKTITVKEKRTVTKYHKVHRGESLGKIAGKYGTTVSQLKKWNGLKSNNIAVGKRLKIYTVEYVEVEKPVEEESATVEETVETVSEEKETVVEERTEDKPKYHTVKRGESLSSIANDYGITLNELREWNGLTDNSIMAGTRLAVDESVAKPAKKSHSDVNTSTYTVKRGESLGKIADKHNMTVEELKDLNGLTSNSIYAGQKLKVEGDAVEEHSEKSVGKAVTHTVRRGESLGKIANKYGVTVSDLRNWNGISGNNIQVGQKLKVSGSKKNSSMHRSKRTHKVRSGENLGVIAEKYGVSVTELKRANGIKGTKINVGQMLRIPD